MGFAIETGKKGWGWVAPNPAVGCVIVDKDHGFLAAGAHLKFGEAHAEINALKGVDSAQLKGATLYVTLEPCAHQGKTGSCAQALAKLPIAKVVYGLQDPNPLVAGQGFGILKNANITVEPFPEFADACAKLCEQFLFNIAHEAPFVALKVGTSFDGKIALNNGQSQWLTGEEARLHGRQLRAHYAATLVGAGTVLKDNPSLDFRDTEFAGKKSNRIVIFDPKSQTLEPFASLKLAELHQPKNIFVITVEENRALWSKQGVQVLNWDSSDGQWQKVLRGLYQAGVSSLYIEGGSFVFGQFLKHHLAQKIYNFQSPKILGNGLSWTQFFENATVDSAPQLQDWQSQRIGKDLLHTGYL